MSTKGTKHFPKFYLHFTYKYQQCGAKCSKKLSIPRNRVFQRAKCAEKQSVPRNRVFQGAKCAEKLSVIGSKMFQGAECSREQTVLRGKVFLGARVEGHFNPGLFNPKLQPQTFQP